MVFRINHIHVKSLDPQGSAEWFGKALGFRVLSDNVRPLFGDRFIRCETADGGLVVNFSNARNGDELQSALSGVHLGLEHFGLDSDDIEGDVERLTSLGAVVEEPIVESQPGTRIVFLRTPDHVRIELIHKS